MAMTIPTIPSMPAGHIATASDMNQLSAAATFLLNKPAVRVHDAAGGLAIGTSATVIPFNTKDFDTDGMWSSGANTLLTIQTPGRYYLSYGVSTRGGHTINTKMRSTTGSNNPAGAGVVSGDHWAGFCPSIAAFSAAAGASGIWPFYLYAGDSLSVFALADTTGNTTDVVISGSYLALEWVSA